VAVRTVRYLERTLHQEYRMEDNAFVQLGVSLLLGLLVGMQRERTESAIAGIRTFPLITAFGTVCAWLAAQHGGWIIAAGLLAVSALLLVANLARIKAGDIDPGLTTEIAALLLFGVGACVVVGLMPVAVALGGAIALLLHFKKPLHEFVKGVGETDIKAIMQFVLVTLVILPVLPNRDYGPYGVLNPFKIWLMVVLMVGISLAGYVAFKLFGAKAGTLLGGLLGGLVSSTATTASYARRSTKMPGSANLAALVIMIASTTVFVRVLVEVAAVAPGNFMQIGPPLATMLAACCVIAAVAFRFNRDRSAELPAQENPAELKSALIFGGLYAVVILAVAAAKDHFGSSGLYAVAVLSGLTDMDAITLSTAQLVNNGTIEINTGWRVILVASLSNLAFKAGIVAALGNRGLLRRISILFGLAVLSGLAILLLWPA
jgi:uncharacterized membrane protein (DUF4010 family)